MRRQEKFKDGSFKAKRRNLRDAIKRDERKGRESETENPVEKEKAKWRKGKKREKGITKNKKRGIWGFKIITNAL